jgi:hypothetical protein
MLVYIRPVNSPRTMVPLLDYNPDISLDLFGILVISYVINLKAPNAIYKLSLSNIDRHLPPVGNV